MSNRDEGTALIVEDILKTETVEEAVGLAMGAVSVAWKPRPEGVFDSENASKLCDALIERIKR